MTLTMADFFCGAGGSSTGAVLVPGVTVRAAANHWKLAVETHNHNHPDALHIQADLSQYDPRYFPGTDIAWFSPSCTHHSIAQGVRRAGRQPDLFGETLPADAAERSRATMWDVVRFTEHHQYRSVLVENVVEVAKWAPYEAWLAAMRSLGYEHRIVCHNSMHAQLAGLPAPQSRDRFYGVFWRAGDRAPDLDRVERPRAVCPDHGPVEAVKSWKRPGRGLVGRYRAQYVYRCPRVECRNRIVEPGWLPAASIIDWSMPGQRIGDRARPLAEKTRARIAAGIAKHWGPIHLEAAGQTYDAADPRHPAHGSPDAYYRAWPMGEPLRTLHGSASKALAVPVEGRAGKSAVPLSEPLRTATTRLETGVALPPLVAELRGGGSTARPAGDPLATVTASGNHHALVTAYYGQGGTQPVTEPLGTCTTVDRHALLQQRVTAAAVEVDDVYFRMLEPSEVKRAMDFPAEYVLLGTRREQVRMSGNAVTPCMARDLVTVVVEALGVTA